MRTAVRDRRWFAGLLMAVLLLGACSSGESGADSETSDQPPASAPADDETSDEPNEEPGDEPGDQPDDAVVDDGGPAPDIDVELLTANPWKLLFGGGPSGPIQAVEGNPVTIDFGLDGTFGGDTGCNGYGGTYEVDGPSATFGEEIFAEQEGCDGAIGAAEAAFLEAMADVTDINLGPGELVLSGLATELIFVPTTDG